MKQLTDNIAFLLGLALAVVMLLLYSATFHSRVIEPKERLEDMALEARLTGMETRLKLLSRAVGERSLPSPNLMPSISPEEDQGTLNNPGVQTNGTIARMDEPMAEGEDLTTRLLELETRLYELEAVPGIPPEVSLHDLATMRNALSLLEIKVDMAAGDYGSADARLDALKARDLTAWPGLGERLAAIGPIKPETRSRAILEMNLSLEEIVSSLGD